MQTTTGWGIVRLRFAITGRDQHQVGVASGQMSLWRVDELRHWTRHSSTGSGQPVTSEWPWLSASTRCYFPLRLSTTPLREL